MTTSSLGMERILRFGRSDCCSQLFGKSIPLRPSGDPKKTVRILNQNLSLILSAEFNVSSSLPCDPGEALEAVAFRLSLR